MKTKLEAGESQFYKKYYANLEGATIVKFKGMLGEDEYDTKPFPTFIVRFKDGSLGEIEISQDEEGNGGGFIFGLTIEEEMRK